MTTSPKKLFYRIAVLIALVSILPFIVFIARREAPPEKIEVEVHKKQVIKDFVLESKGKKVWKLTAPEATFEGEKCIKLKNPVLRIYNKEIVILKSPAAVYNQKSGKLEVSKVTIVSKGFYAESEKGVYSTSKEVFRTEGSCYIKIKETNQIWGKKCVLDLKKRKFIINSNVRSQLRGVER